MIKISSLSNCKRETSGMRPAALSGSRCDLLWKQHGKDRETTWSWKGFKKSTKYPAVASLILRTLHSFLSCNYKGLPPSSLCYTGSCGHAHPPHQPGAHHSDFSRLVAWGSLQPSLPMQEIVLHAIGWLKSSLTPSDLVTPRSKAFSVLRQDILS